MHFKGTLIARKEGILITALLARYGLMPSTVERFSFDNVTMWLRHNTSI